MSRCNTCFRHCEIKEGGLGFCGARTCKDGIVKAENYGLVTSVALDPIEKKPLYHFYPGSKILSVGSYGCNLHCPFCQNDEISWSERAYRYANTAEYLSPEELTEMAIQLKPRGNIGVAFTYNEPLIGWEYVLDTAKLIRAAGMKNVIVTNGTAELSVLEKLAPYIDSMNIDIKGFTDEYYRDLLKGDRQTVMEFIEAAAKVCHIELTTLVIPNENDSKSEMRELSSWIAGLDGKGEIPYHISRFFPCFHMTDRAATDIGKVYRLAEVAREKLKYVYTGNC
ncbi:MAG: AmmeMemoRadiSam system radical SAM enzyme [Lachnospiraceae bacterium]|nr:AmmeMemoRadiSam system radical SAM enzyme [Lachnospiraceae bacterium]